MRKIKIGVIGHMAKMRRIFQEILKGYNETYIDSKFDYETAYAETPLLTIRGIPIISNIHELQSQKYDVVYVQNGMLTEENYPIISATTLSGTHIIEL